jgi:hypothetical protein
MNTKTAEVRFAKEAIEKECNELKGRVFQLQGEKAKEVEHRVNEVQALLEKINNLQKQNQEREDKLQKQLAEANAKLREREIAEYRKKFTDAIQFWDKQISDQELLRKGAALSLIGLLFVSEIRKDEREMRADRRNIKAALAEFDQDMKHDDYSPKKSFDVDVKNHKVESLIQLPDWYLKR